ncbi:hypothetical protein [Halomonas sp. KO116]|uniref:hypothetical protein n=1 Tax=Halomonas sp. KO116 TaxID=1504981 RepID=UPI0004E37A1D|nr:hypothetical protein [Halomonas sp. KO116]AJY53307.1 hypothetical protein KO116_P200200 [Halomonas sp. KO116]
MNEQINTDEVLAMNGQDISSLSVEQRQKLNQAIEKSRLYGLAISVTNKATSEDLAIASSAEDAERIMAEAGSVISVRKQ